jgi:FtsP/CotA-like multicopper oxidase with cupredoxin domain
MKKTNLKLWSSGLCGALALSATTAQGDWFPSPDANPRYHLVDGITGTNTGGFQATRIFRLTAREGHIHTGEGSLVYVWGFSESANPLVQYPSPTLLVQQNELVTVLVSNALPFRVSIVFPGQQLLPTPPPGASGTPGLLTREALPGATVGYQFRATNAGTYIYNSGTRPDLQVAMGMVGALIVRPTGFNPASAANRRAYGTADSAFDHEYLFLLTEMDPVQHDDVERLRRAWNGQGEFNPSVDTTTHFANYWFINGRTAPDVMMIPFSKALPSQPYDSMPMMHPGQKLLMRVVGGGRDAHPWHHHGNHALNIARNGRLLRSSPAVASADLAYRTFTIPAYPGETTDAIFTWTGQGLGWDMYGHSPTDPLQEGEDPADHGKPFPVILPAEADMDFGAWYGGTPFLGTAASLPPNRGGFDPTGAFIFMWHSHSEREIVNNNVFPGGMLTMLMIEPWGM